MMSERVWDKFLTERDRAVFAAGGFGARAGFGKRPGAGETGAAPSLGTNAPPLDGNEIAAPIAPMPQDIVIRKQKPSGFFGSNLASYLTLLGCDSLVVTGTTTSGCVRATVVDAF